MLGLGKLQFYAVVAFVFISLAGGVVYWLRADAVADHRNETKLKVAEERLEHTKKALEVKNEINEMDDTQLRDALSRRLLRR